MTARPAVWGSRIPQHAIPVRRYAYTQQTFALEGVAAQAMKPMEPIDPDAGGYSEVVGYGLWFGWLFGFAGLHRFYLGKYMTGLLWMLTWGLFGIGQIFDLVRMKKLVRDANIREGYLPHPRWAAELNRMAHSPAALPTAPEKTLKHQLLDAAMALKGELSVTEGVAATGASFEAVENTLNELLETGYVDIDNRPDSGVIVYRFTELR